MALSFGIFGALSLACWLVSMRRGVAALEEIGEAG
jgi:hypothetical protein